MTETLEQAIYKAIQEDVINEIQDETLDLLQEENRELTKGEISSIIQNRLYEKLDAIDRHTKDTDENQLTMYITQLAFEYYSLETLTKMFLETVNS